MEDLSSVYEKLGVFYLGRDYDLKTREMGNNLLLYDSKDLVTHAVVVGMTGSGKTGLGVSMLEEAAIDGIPALVVDPKGDLTNLLLSFPELAGEDFKPWVHREDADREGISVDELAQNRADLWRKGLGEWHQSPDRIKAMRDKCEFNIYTPGSDAGIPISILSSFAPPPPAVMEDADLLRDRIMTTATSLLTLLGIDADPIQSREHILITTILDHCWRKRMSMDLGTLIQMVQSPPVTKVGVMDLDSFYPSKDRFQLAMAMNNLLASPSFASWMTGEPLDVDRLLYSPTGKPRISIFSIAHLGDNERMFFMSLLLNQTLSWMRSRPGTTSLRAMLYIDEIFGYMPPVANPPSKKPLLTLLKQARAFGLGLVLATQNPVDLDYKGLSNTGTWFLGRLQTEQDKDRVLDGLQGASAEAGGGFDRERISEILSGVGKRVFLMHNVHDQHPVTFHTRWALSYLAGPMTRTQIKKLMDEKKPDLAREDTYAETAPAMPGAPVEETAAPAPTPEPQRPVLPPDISQVYLPVRRAYSGNDISYEPRFLAMGRIHFVDTRKGLSADEELAMLSSFDGGAFGMDWEEAVHLQMDSDELDNEPMAPGEHREVPAEATKAKSYTAWRKSLADHIYRSRRFVLLKCAATKDISEPGETERDFRIRISEEVREKRDAEVAKLRKKYTSKMDTLEERIRKAELRVEREAQEASGAKMQTAISFGATILSAVMGRKTFSSTTVGRAASAARGIGRSAKQADDVRRAEADVESYTRKLEDLTAELESEIEEIEDKYDADSLELDEQLLKPRKTDIDIRHVALAWVPFGRDAAGTKIALFRE